MKNRGQTLICDLEAPNKKIEHRRPTTLASIDAMLEKQGGRLRRFQVDYRFADPTLHQTSDNHAVIEQQA